MADSSIAVTGGNVDTRTASNGDHRQVMVMGDGSTDNVGAVTAAGEQLIWVRASNLTVTATSTAGAAVTLTLPAVAANFHYITHMSFELYSSAARTGAAAAAAITTTNITGSPVWNFSTAGAIGTMERLTENRTSPLKSTTINTATTFVAALTAGGIWRLRVSYFTAP